MKKNIITLLILLCVCSYGRAQCTLVNNGFENWQFQPYNSAIGTVYMDTPDNWKPLVSQFLLAFSNVMPGIGQQNSIVYTGSASLMFFADTSGNFMDGGDMMNISACSTDPDTLYAYYRAEGFTNGDSAVMMAFAIDYASGTGDTIGFGVRYITSDQLTWNNVSVPLTYSASGADSLVTYIAFFPNNPTQSKYLFLDNFTLQAPSAIQDFKPIENVRLYPNPATEFVTLTGIMPGDKITVNDFTGRLIEERTALTDSIILLKENHRAGMYSVIIARADKVKVSLVCKIK